MTKIGSDTLQSNLLNTLLMIIMRLFYMFKENYYFILIITRKWKIHKGFNGNTDTTNEDIVNATSFQDIKSDNS